MKFDNSTNTLDRRILTEDIFRMHEKTISADIVSELLETNLRLTPTMTLESDELLDSNELLDRQVDWNLNHDSEVEKNELFEVDLVDGKPVKLPPHRRLGSQNDMYPAGGSVSGSVTEEESLDLQEREEESSRPSYPAVSRLELLDIIRKHSENLLKPMEWFASAHRPVDGALMDPRYWKEILDLFFVRGWGQGSTSLQFDHGALFDDMLFFVRNDCESSETLLENSSEGTPHDKRPYFVRRWGNDLNKIVGYSASEIDWRISFYLNLICHSSYTLTMVTCSRQALEEFKQNPRGRPVEPIKKVTRRVYASPSVARVDSGPPQADQSGFPDIFFSVDDFNDALEPMDLLDPDYCLCVMLNAHGGAAFPLEESGVLLSPGLNPSPRRSSTQAQAFGEDIDGIPKVTLFSGFVNYAMVRNSFHGGPSGAIFQPDPFAPERLVMKGPGGHGEADVTVWGVPEEPPKRANLPPRPPRPSRPPRPPRPNTTFAPSTTARLPRMSLRDLQGQLIRVKDELLALVQSQQALGLRTDLSPEVKSREEKICGEKLLLLHEELRLVQRRLEVMQRQEKSEVKDRSDRSQKEESFTEFVKNTVTKAAFPALKCSLRSLCIPWDVLAFDLLFKGVPMKVDISGHIMNRPISREAARRVPESY